MPDKINLIYLMGAGRSGTTALATFLGGHPDIETIGEMHQFFDHLEQNKTCSCGKQLTNCSYWSQIIEKLPQNYIENASELNEICKEFEYHSSIPKHIWGVNNTRFLKYSEIQNIIFSVLKESINSSYYLDSAKYIGRHLSLRKNRNISVKTIYVIRDVRGVINSFNKKVQSSRHPLSAVFYYVLVNLTAECIYQFSAKDTILKIRYEDFIKQPEKTLKEIGNFLNLDMKYVSEAINQNQAFSIGHIIGGNRLRKNGKIKLNPDISWKNNQTRIQQIFYYIMALPIMLINRYKL